MADAGEDSARPETNRTLLWAGTAFLGLCIVAGISIIAAARNNDDENSSVLANMRTAKVEQRDLVERKNFPAILGFADQRRVTASSNGTVTSLPTEGSLVAQGETLYEIDNSSVILLYGKKPAWRPLSIENSKGPDIRQLEENLVALGYAKGAVTVDETFTTATAEAVKRLQSAVGHSQTGTIDIGRFVFLSGPQRIGAHLAQIGDRVRTGAPVIALTSNNREVVVRAPALEQKLFTIGEEVLISLPASGTITGTISSVGQIVIGTTPGQGEESGRSYIEVHVDLANQSATGDLDQVPVTVKVEKERAEKVLAVPVQAVFAADQGGFAVEVAPGGNIKKAVPVPVETGLYGGGWVQVTGDIKKGDIVVIAP